MRTLPRREPTSILCNGLAKGSIRVRTYERGVEGETLACGTGVTASALIAAELASIQVPVKVQVQGGDIVGSQFQGK